MNSATMKKLAKLQEKKAKVASQLSDVASEEQELTETLLKDLGRELMDVLGTEDVLEAHQYIQDNVVPY